VGCGRELDRVHAADIERDLRLFQKKTRQYVFISSASVYQKPLAHPVVTESTPSPTPTGNTPAGRSPPRNV